MKNNEVYALIKLDPKKIAEANISVKEVDKKIDEFSRFGEVSHYESLESLALENGLSQTIEKAYIPDELIPLVDYIKNCVNSATKTLQEQLTLYKQQLENIKNIVK